MLYLNLFCYESRFFRNSGHWVAPLSGGQIAYLKRIPLIYMIIIDFTRRRAYVAGINQRLKGTPDAHVIFVNLLEIQQSDSKFRPIYWLGLPPNARWVPEKVNMTRNQIPQVCKTEPRPDHRRVRHITQARGQDFVPAHD